jgi:hypothetical protein
MSERNEIEYIILTVIASVAKQSLCSWDCFATLAMTEKIHSKIKISSILPSLPRCVQHTFGNKKMPSKIEKHFIVSVALGLPRTSAFLQKQMCERSGGLERSVFFLFDASVHVDEPRQAIDVETISEKVDEPRSDICMRTKD